MFPNSNDYIIKNRFYYVGLVESGKIENRNEIACQLLMRFIVTHCELDILH